MKSIRRNFCLIARIVIMALWGSFVLFSFQPASAQVRPDWKERWDRTVSATKKEGKVVVFGPPGELIRQGLIDGFKKAFPEVALEFSGARGPELATKVRSERDAGIYTADLIISGATTGLTMFKPMKALDPIEPFLILPEVKDPKYWRDNKLLFADKEGKLVFVFVSQLLPVLAYNQAQVKVEEVDELYELLDPKWKGKIVINDPLPTGAGFVVFRYLWHTLGKEKATDYFGKLREQAAVVDRDQRRQIEWVAQGKYPMLFAPSGGVMGQLVQRGLKFGVLPEFKDYGTSVTVSFGGAMIMNRAPHPNAAAVFLNWFLSREGQTIWSKAMNSISRRLDVPTDHLPSYIVPRPNAKYWLVDIEENIHRLPEEEKILKELFGR
ncbi:MAG: ABC transporter substrate-binding protein [Candidatus Binatia bacterium]